MGGNAALPALVDAGAADSSSLAASQLHTLNFRTLVSFFLRGGKSKTYDREVMYLTRSTANRLCRWEKDVPPMSTLLRLLLESRRSPPLLYTHCSRHHRRVGSICRSDVSRDVIDPVCLYDVKSIARVHHNNPSKRCDVRFQTKEKGEGWRGETRHYVRVCMCECVCGMPLSMPWGPSMA